MFESSAQEKDHTAKYGVVGGVIALLCLLAAGYLAIG